MNLKIIISYSVPLFVIAIVSRSIEEINFLYYTVPVFCLFYIFYNVLTATKMNPSRLVNKLSQATLKVSVRTISEQPSRLPADKGTLTSKIFPIIFWLPGIWFLLTSLWSSYPAISATRALYFVLISGGCVSAGILWFRFSGKGVLDFLLPANIIVVLICLFSLITNIPSDSWSGGNGKGLMSFFGHQNLLASVLLFTMPAVIYRIIILVKSGIRQNNDLDSRRTSFAGMTVRSDSSFRRSPESEITTHYSLLTAYSLLLTANLLLLTLTYSRAAIISLIFGVFVFLILSRKWKLIAYSFSLIAVFAIVIYSVPTLNNFSREIINKDFPELYSSRMWMWQPSYEAALDGGFVGLGFGISDPNVKVGGVGDHFEGERFVREKGNSLLALVEETGLIGLALFLLPIILLFKHGYMNVFSPAGEVGMYDHSNHSVMHPVPAKTQVKAGPYKHAILLATLIAFILHSQFEAWCVGVGSVQLPIFFIYLGLYCKYQP